MKMIWGIFKRDMCHATRNVIAVIVSMGLVVVPALYAWFNIAASWNPYGNTKALKVAVANNDKGYKSDLIPVRVNVGETIISTRTRPMTCVIFAASGLRHRNWRQMTMSICW